MGKMVKPGFLAFVLIILILMGSVIIYFQKSKQTQPKQHFLIKDLPCESILQKATIKGINKKNGVWILKADKILSKDNLSEIRFTSPDLLITLNDNSTIWLSAQNGIYYRKLKRIEFIHKIKGRYKNIMLNASLMHFNLRFNKIIFKNGIKITNTQLSVSGLKGIVDLNKHIIIIKKNVKVTII